MPELPEVETVRRGLAPVFENAEILGLDLARPDLRFPFPERFAERVAGRRVLSLGRRAKYLLADLDDGEVIVAHLGMSGAFRIETDGEAVGGEAETVAAHAFVYPRSQARAHDHVVFRLKAAAGGVPMRIVYNDPRRFGFMTMVRREAIASHPYFRNLGVEPTGNALDGDLLARLFAGKAAPLKAALLDQRLVAGLGNIYVCEALYRAGLSPVAPAGTIATKAGRASVRAERLADAIRSVIDEAIAAGGSTLRDHRQANGELGYFQHSFSVYGREGEPCRTLGCGAAVARIVQSGRSTFHCPRCQK
ncbi:bifunctional DNA-formamidopyrimidine glycosylase/DNA-(apurinic or apyrimidinic site) lyase [Stappia sp. ICDLI1TA098]